MYLLLREKALSHNSNWFLRIQQKKYMYVLEPERHELKWKYQKIFFFIQQKKTMELPKEPIHEKI